MKTESKKIEPESEKKQSENAQKDRSSLIHSVRQITTARNRDEMTTDGGTTGRSDGGNDYAP